PRSTSRRPPIPHPASGLQAPDQLGFQTLAAACAFGLGNTKTRVSRAASDMLSAVAGMAGTPKVASAAPPMAEPKAWPTEITEPLRARATGAPPVSSISRA